MTSHTICHIMKLTTKHFDWSQDKNEILKLERGVSFQDVMTAIDEGRLLDDIVHTNQNKYPNQKMYIVNIENYIYLVPYVEDSIKIFFKTIIPSRKATKDYLHPKR